jgi:carboxypeptidase Taq
LHAQRPQVEEEIAAGQFGGLFSWLQENVHGLGAKISIQELMANATGKPVSAAASLRYLEAKYLEAPVEATA